MDAPPPANNNGNAPTPPPTANPNPGGPQSVTITFRDSRSFEQSFKLKTTTKLGKAMDAFSARTERGRGSLRFLFEGQRINDNDTVDTMEMQDGDIVEAMEEQIGGKK